jgi:hypothetical protein
MKLSHIGKQRPSVHPFATFAGHAIRPVSIIHNKWIKLQRLVAMGAFGKEAGIVIMTIV